MSDTTPATFTGIPACPSCGGIRGHWLGCHADDTSGAGK